MRRIVDCNIFTGTLWFLTSLFGALLLSYFVLKFSKKVQLFVCILFILFSYCLAYYKVILPFNLDISLFMVLFIISAVYFKEKLLTCQFTVYGVMYSTIILIITCGVMLLFNVKQVNYYGGNLGIIPLSTLSAYGGIYIILYIAQSINRWGGIIRTFLIFVGTNSIIFFIIHQQMIIYPMNVFDIFESTPFFDGLLRYVLIIVSCSVLTKIINKYLPWTIK